MKTLSKIDQNFEAAILDAMNTTPLNYELGAHFLFSNNNTPRYVIGKNSQSIEITKLVKIDGVIDDNSVEDKWMNIPIFPMSRIPGNAIVVNCSTSISPVLVNKNLLNAGIKNILNISELIHASNNLISLPWFVNQQRKDYCNHTQAWNTLYQSLADQESKQTLLDVVRYRLTADPKYMKNYRIRFNEQYFEDFMALKSETFVDAGGFDGDTTEQFCKRYPDYKKVYLFEPSLKNIQAAQVRLTSFRNIEFLNVGLSDKEDILNFNPNAGPASAISLEANETINVTTLDKQLMNQLVLLRWI